MRTIFKFVVLAFALSASIAMADTTSLEHHQPYTTVTPVKGDELTVIEFFKFSCPVCRSYQPVMDNWSRSLPKPIIFKYVPVYEGTESSAGAMKMYWAMNSIANIAQKTAFMNAAYSLVQDLHQGDNPGMWRDVVISAGIQPDEFSSAWQLVSRNSSSFIAQQTHYSPTVTPTIVICGKYMLNPDNVMGDQDLFIRLANGLLSKCLMENGFSKDRKLGYP